MPSNMTSKDTYLVIGGSGFVGRHIVEQLLQRGDIVSVLDIVQRHYDVPFYPADISDQEQVSEALRKSGVSCIIHTASPHANLKDAALYWRVNVEGTKAIISAAQANGVRKLVFTSSAGVIFNGADIIGADERLPPPEIHFDPYNESKAVAEKIVLAANGKSGLLTVALRPAGIFGEGDRQLMAGLSKVYENNQTHIQVGYNTNLFDWTYVGNVARAHLLAADVLSEPSEPSNSTTEKSDQDSLRIPTPQEECNLSYSLPFVDLTAPDALARHGSSPPHVAGQVFFITNGEPVYFWDLPRAVWTLLDERLSSKRPKKRSIVLPRALGLAAAAGAEWWGWLVGREPVFTKVKVIYSCATRWHDIEKARRVLGYEPEVSLAEGITRTVDWWLKENGYIKV